jgi:primosomal protein N' (replication factor Y)
MTATEPKKQEKVYAEIAVPVPLRRTFTYRIPGELADEIAIGARVLVPFGKQLLTGYAVAFHTEPDADVSPEDIRDIAELVDAEPLISAEMLQLTQWAADYYAASWGEILKASLPAGINSSVEKVAVITEAGRLQAQVDPGKTVRARTLAHIAENDRASFGDLLIPGGAGPRREIPKLEKLGLVTITLEEKEEKARPKLQRVARLIETGSGGKKLNAAQEKVIGILAANGGALPAAELIKQADVSASVLKTLEKNGLIELNEEEVFRDPLLHATLPEINDITLTGAQSEALEKIEAKIAANEYHTFLLHGITGSGKTEVYIRAMRRALAQGRTAMMLVPEIALTPIFSRRLRAIFGDEVAILHSSLSLGERFDEWRRLKSGEARIAIGTRSAVFAPLENLGVIVVDEEHDASYRQHEQRGKYEYLHLPDRIGNRPLAKAEVIDMRLTFAEKGRDEVFSDELLTSIERTHAQGEQSIILLNRRGYSSFILCRKCGESIKCPNCDITLTYHKRADSLVCHYCNFRRRMPDKCPNCTSEFLFYVGEGTEQLADILREKFPHIRSARLDRDTVSRRHLFEDTILDFAAGKLDMLVGTQMLAKGHDFPNVTLVGVVSVDAGLGLPDFRSAERTFQLLTQVAGRAGRGEKSGRVLIQTYYPEHYALQYAQQQDYPGFYKEEIVFRERFGFPPFASLASVLVHHANYEYAWQTAQLVRNCLTMANTEKKVVILGPAPAPLARLKGEFRVQILLKSQNRKRLRTVLDRAWAELAERHSDMRVIKVEIDPLNLM